MSSNVDVAGWRRPWAQHAAALVAFVLTAVACGAVMVHAFENESVGQFFAQVPESMVRGVLDDVRHPVELLAPTAHEATTKTKHHATAHHATSTGVTPASHTTTPATTTADRTTSHSTHRAHQAGRFGRGHAGAFAGFGHGGWANAFGRGSSHALGRLTRAMFGGWAAGFESRHSSFSGHGSRGYGSWGSSRSGGSTSGHGSASDALTSRGTAVAASLVRSATRFARSATHDQHTGWASHGWTSHSWTSHSWTSHSWASHSRGEGHGFGHFGFFGRHHR